MKVEQLMNKNVATCRPEDTLNEVARVFWDCDTGCLPVIDHESRVIGMITDRDVCLAAFFQGASLKDLWVGNTMARRVHSARVGDDLEGALELMRTHQVRRLPVVDANGRITGLLSITDVVHSGAKGGELKPKRVLKAVASITERRLPQRSVEIVIDVKPALPRKRARSNGKSKAQLMKPKKRPAARRAR